MNVEFCELWNKEGAFVHYNLPKIVISHSENEPPLPVAIGIDPSTTSTGFTIGRTDMDYPMVGMQFKRGKDDTPFEFISDMMNYILYSIIGNNNLDVKFIFSEDKYEGSRKYNRHTQEMLSTVKIAVNSLPSRIKDNGQQSSPKLSLMKPSEWRKIYLGDLNTNSKRMDIKTLDCNFTINKYGLHPNFIFYEDMLESMAIYSSGFKKFIEPNLKNSNTALVDMNSIDWGHNYTCHRIITVMNENTIKEIASQDLVMQNRISKYGLKSFKYERGFSLEKNIRGLTSKSNAVFMTILDTWDLEAIAVYYELKRIPKNNQEKLLIMAYRDKEKVF